MKLNTKTNPLPSQLMMWGGGASAVGALPLYFFVDIKLGIIATAIGFGTWLRGGFLNDDLDPYYVTVEEGKQKVLITIRRRRNSGSPPREFDGDYYNGPSMSYTYAEIDPSDDEALVEALVNAKSLVNKWIDERDKLSRSAKRARKLLKA